MSDNVATFLSFTGAPPEQAAMFLEMAGGDVETAVAIFFSSQEGGGAVPMEEDAGAAVDVADAVSASMAPEVPPWWHVVWPAAEEPPEAWRNQRLDGEGSPWKGGILQPKNGPCGILAVVHGLVLAEQHMREPAEVSLDAGALAKVIHGILERCRRNAGAPLRLARPKVRGSYGPGADLEVVDFADGAAAAAEVQARIDDFRAPGGVLDLLYSAVFTHGIDAVKGEALEEGGELPLVPRAFGCWLCSMELMSLLLRGNARGNVGAFSADGSRNESWDSAAKIGILSRKEKEGPGVPMSEALKNPPCPVWILHGGDHFTLAWSKSMPTQEIGAEFKLHVWNGLPPGGPSLSELQVKAVQGTAFAKQEMPKYYKPEPGEIEEVVQADPEDKKAFPGQYRQWRYEVMLAWDNPDVEGEVRPEGMPPEPKYDQGDARYQRSGPWRCCLCYARRFQTMDFSLVPEDSPDSCPKCDKPRKECGWSMWVPYADLPPKRQATVMNEHAKKIETILWTRWPAAEISLVEGGTVVEGGKLPDC